MDRRTIVQRIINKLEAKNYLEIGVAKGQTLLRMKVKHRVAVDPEFKMSWRAYISSLRNTKYKKMTSDEYFENYNEKFDVVFIDGLHTYKQSFKDALNSLKRSNFVVLHDCNPASAEISDPPQPADKPWSGEVWKTILSLRALGYDASVLDCDFGVGLVINRMKAPFAYNLEQIESLRYRDLEANREKYLNLKSPEYFEEWLKNCN